MCIVKDCKTRATYAMQGQKATHCKAHKLENMVNVVNKRGIHTKIKAHKLEGIIDVKHKHCIHTIDSLTLITSKKYKTVGELLKGPIKSIIRVSDGEKNEDVRSYLYEWLYNNHYSNKRMVGSLTTRIKNISNQSCYYYIMKECFNIVGSSNFNKTTTKILNNECIHFIERLHIIDPRLTGTFLDYLVRRIICERKQIHFHDSRAECQTHSGNEINSDLDNKEVWTFIINDDFNSWRVFKNPSIKSTCIINIRCGSNFIVKTKKNEWLNIEYKNCTGWIRYFIPNSVDFANEESDKNEYIENKYIQRVEPIAHSPLSCNSCFLMHG